MLHCMVRVFCSASRLQSAMDPSSRSVAVRRTIAYSPTETVVAESAIVACLDSETEQTRSTILRSGPFNFTLIRRTLSESSHMPAGNIAGCQRLTAIDFSEPNAGRPDCEEVWTAGAVRSINGYAPLSAIPLELAQSRTKARDCQRPRGSARA